MYRRKRTSNTAPTNRLRRTDIVHLKVDLAKQSRRGPSLFAHATLGACAVQLKKPVVQLVDGKRNFNTVCEVCALESSSFIV